MERPAALLKDPALCRDNAHHSRRTDDFPQQLVRFQEESGLPWAEPNRRLDTDPETVRCWRDKGVRPSTRHMMALVALANSLGLDHIPLEFRPDADDGPTAPTRGPGACLRATHEDVNPSTGAARSRRRAAYAAAGGPP